MPLRESRLSLLLILAALATSTAVAADQGCASSPGMSVLTDAQMQSLVGGAAPLIFDVGGGQNPEDLCWNPSGCMEEYDHLVFLAPAQVNWRCVRGGTTWAGCQERDFRYCGVRSAWDTAPCTGRRVGDPEFAGVHRGVSASKLGVSLELNWGPWPPEP